MHSQSFRSGPKIIREYNLTVFKRMLGDGAIEPARSEWASPVVFVPKPDGSVRLCVNYRRLNAIPLKYTYRLPRIDECLDSLGNDQFFTMLDCNSGYWKLRPKIRKR